MVVRIIQGSRSRHYAAKNWSCDACGHFNKVNSFLIFDLPPFHCGNCQHMFDGIVYFNLADVEVNGKSLLPEVKNQGKRPECVPYAFAHAQELNDIVENIIFSDESPIEIVDPMVLAETYKLLFGDETQTRYGGEHKILYTALILKESARMNVKDKARSTRSDVVASNMGKPEHTCQCIADGRGVVGTFWAGKHFHELKFGEVYSPPQGHGANLGHAVLLIGAIYYVGRIIYIFLNSWGEEFCALRDENGKLIVGGIGMVESSPSCNPVVLSRSWEKGANGQLSGSWRLDLTHAEAVLDAECIEAPAKLMPTFTIKEINACAGSYSCQIPVNWSSIAKLKLRNNCTFNIECNYCSPHEYPRDEGCKSIAVGMNAMDLRCGISIDVDAMVINLKGMARIISPPVERSQDGSTLCNELEVVEGMKLNGDYISLHFITNEKKKKM